MAIDPNCPYCQGEGWVCENHERLAWNENKPGGCECGAGAPCRLCNSGSPTEAPLLPPGSTIICGFGKVSE